MILTYFVGAPCQIDPTGVPTPLQYRYKLTPAMKVNSFRPKELPSELDKCNLRGSQLGAFYNNRFQKLPRASHCDVIWEA